MKLPSFKRLLKLDYEATYQKLIETLSNSLNYGIEVLYSAMNRQLSLTDNLLCDLKQVQVSTDTSGTPTSSVSFQLSNKAITTVQGIQVINVQNTTNTAAFPTGGVQVSFSLTQNSGSSSASSPYIVNITNVKGLIAGNNYTLTLIIWG